MLSHLPVRIMGRCFFMKYPPLENIFLCDLISAFQERKTVPLPILDPLLISKLPEDKGLLTLLLLPPDDKQSPLLPAFAFYLIQQGLSMRYISSKKSAEECVFYWQGWGLQASGLDKKGVYFSCPKEGPVKIGSAYTTPKPPKSDICMVEDVALLKDAYSAEDPKTQLMSVLLTLKEQARRDKQTCFVVLKYPLCKLPDLLRPEGLAVADAVYSLM